MYCFPDLIYSSFRSILRVYGGMVAVSWNPFPVSSKTVVRRTSSGRLAKRSNLGIDSGSLSRVPSFTNLEDSRKNVLLNRIVVDAYLELKTLTFSSATATEFKKNALGVLRRHHPGSHALIYNTDDSGFENHAKCVVFRTVLNYRDRVYALYAFRSGGFKKNEGSNDWAFVSSEKVKRTTLREIV